MHRLARTVEPYDDDREFLLSYILSISVIWHASGYVPCYVFMKPLEEMVHGVVRLAVPPANRPQQTASSLSISECKTTTRSGMGLFYYYTFGLPSFLVTVIALYLLFTGTSPLYLSIALALRISVLLSSVARVQVQAKRSMSAAFLKRRAHTSGPRSA